MKFRGLDSNGDWLFGKGLQDYAPDKQSINLNVQTLIRSWVGDCFFDTQAGINWKRLIGYGQQVNLDSSLQTLILGAYGIVRIKSASVVVNPATRAFSAQYVVDTVYSQEVVNSLAILGTP